VSIFLQPTRYAPFLLLLSSPQELVHALYEFLLFIVSNLSFFFFRFVLYPSRRSLDPPSIYSPYPHSLYFAPMDDPQSSFATQYPSYGFDTDMMKVCTPRPPCTLTFRCPFFFRGLWIPLAVQMLKRLAGLPHPRSQVLAALTPPAPLLAMHLPTTAMAHKLAYPSPPSTTPPLPPVALRAALSILLPH
jgi:hypothetical protein